MAANTKAREAAAAAGDLDALARLEQRRPAEDTVILADDDSLAADMEAAVQAERAAKFGGDDAFKAEAAAQLATVREAVAKDAITINLRSIGRRRYDELMRAHPATDEDHEEVRQITGQATARARYHGETFVPALVAACMAEAMGLPPDDAADVAKKLDALADQGRVSEGELNQMFQKATRLHEGSRTADLGK